MSVQFSVPEQILPVTREINAQVGLAVPPAIQDSRFGTFLPKVTTEEMARLLDAPGVAVVDARMPRDFEGRSAISDEHWNRINDLLPPPSVRARLP
jgi:hypothetical protein